MTATGFVLPVGHYLGRYHPRTHTPARYHKVRLGRDLLRLSDDMFRLWTLCHGVPGRPWGEPWTRQAVLDAARRLTGPERGFDTLVGDGLVVEIAPDTPEAVRFARGYRVEPLMTGLGNTATEPLRFGIGMLGQPPTVTVDVLGFELWQWGRLDPDLWQVAHRLASVQGRVSDGSADPERMLTEILRRLPVLLCHHAVYLDRARKPPAGPPAWEAPDE